MNMPTEPKSPNGMSTLIVALFIIIGIGIIFVNKCSKNVDTKQDQSNLINALYDTIRTLKENSIESTVRIKILQMESTARFNALKINDAEIVKLQQTVESYKKSLKAGSSVTNTTVDTHIDKTTPIVVRDTVISTRIEKDTILNTTVLSSKYSDEWLSYSIVSIEDSVTLKLNITNEYSVILGYDKKVPFADVINYNPYSKVTKLRTFQVSVPKQKKWGIGISSGIGFSTNLIPRPYIGIGINYNIIKF